MFIDIRIRASCWHRGGTRPPTPLQPSAAGGPHVDRVRAITYVGAVHVTRHIIRPRLRLLLAWLAACGGDTPVEESLDGRTFLLESSEGFEPVAGTTVRLSFREGSLGFSAGCNSHDGEYVVRDGILIMQNLSSTEIGCDAARHAQDMLLADFMTSMPQLRRDEDQLTLTGEEITLVFLDREVADPDRPLASTEWTIDTFIEGGAASNLPLASAPTLRFEEDGSWQVDTTCNTGAGRYTADGGQLVLSSVTYTAASCSGASAAADSHIQKVLRAGMLSYEIEADRLKLTRGSVGLSARALSTGSN
jgi:heat shock protein HslJ